MYFKAGGEVNETISFHHLCYVHNLKNFRSANNLPIEGSKFRLSVSHVSAMKIPQLSSQFLVKDYQALKSMMSSRAAEAAQQYVASKLLDSLVEYRKSLNKGWHKFREVYFAHKTL